MENLTPTARLTYDAIRDHGPGNVHELRERTSRSRSATDKAIAELATAGLITKVDGGDPADGAPARWQLADVPAPEQDAAAPVAAEPSAADPLADEEQTSGIESAEDEPDQDPAGEGETGNVAPERESTEPAEAEKPQPKLCRGCQNQMSAVCEHCWQKTPAYCGTCRRDMPQIRRGEPGEPLILSNGLPKLRPGELEILVANVIASNPVPHHVGVTGWTSGRVAIYLPGRSTGAIGNAMRKLANTGVLQLVGDRPERYEPVAAVTSAGQDDSPSESGTVQAGEDGEN